MTIINILLAKRFVNGLKNYNLTLEDIRKNWKYAGGDSCSHLSYFEVCFPQKLLPTHKDVCICNQKIKENCYITNNKYFLVIGNCCIKRLVPTCTRTGEKFEMPHKNRKENLCSECRELICQRCKGPCKKEYAFCYSCFTELYKT